MILLNIPVVHVQIDLHALIMNKFEHMVLRIGPTDSNSRLCELRIDYLIEDG